MDARLEAREGINRLRAEEACVQRSSPGKVPGKVSGPEPRAAVDRADFSHFCGLSPCSRPGNCSCVFVLGVSYARRQNLVACCGAPRWLTDNSLEREEETPHRSRLPRRDALPVASGGSVKAGP